MVDNPLLLDIPEHCGFALVSRIHHECLSDGILGDILVCVKLAQDD